MDVKRTQSENDNPVFVITSDKLKTKYYVKKANNGFALFNIEQDKGSVAKELSGSFTTPDKAIAKIKEYLRTKKPSVAVRRDENTRIREERKKSNASAAKPNDSKHVQQGASN
jgi:hypothetical protein|tara:strand:- start:20371 stop:20709 length:339 start_codon:yes stop_codon:yes gene_type:complete